MIQLADARLVINNNDVPLMPNSFAYTEGLGEQETKSVSSGDDGEVEQLYVDNVEGKFSMFKFDLPVTIDTIKMARSWKNNRNRNTARVVSGNDEGDFSRTFTQASLNIDYELGFGADTSISIEFKSNPAV